jgi:hypothetical protein
MLKCTIIFLYIKTLQFKKVQNTLKKHFNNATPTYKPARYTKM